MPIDMFDPRTLLRAVEQMKPPRTFLKDTFFRMQETFQTETVDIDLVKGKRRLAPFVHPRIGSKTVEHAGYQTQTYKPPMVAPDYPVTGDDIKKRLPGENIYSGSSPNDRLATFIGQKMAEFDEMITRREEWMAAQALFEGKINVIGDGVNDVIDFNFTNKEVLTSTARWSDAASDPLADLKRYKRTIVQTSGINPTHCVMGFDAIDAFVNNAKVQKLLDLRKVEIGAIDPQILPNGVTYHGYLKELGLDIYSYEEWYVDPADDQEKPMVPAKKVLLASANAGFKMLYGAIIDVTNGTFAMPRVPNTWKQYKPSAQFLQLASRPLPVPTQVDSYYVSTVL